VPVYLKHIGDFVSKVEARTQGPQDRKISRPPPSY
jgi:hypothetical protein